MIRIEDYIPIVGQATVEELGLLADRLRGKAIQNINSTAVGGGVAEILSRMIPLLSQLGVSAAWDVIKGDEKFFAITKKFHNGLHGVPVEIDAGEYAHFLEVNRYNAEQIRFGDIVFVHDPQPIALVEKRGAIGKNWLWRCHIDFSRPDPKIWEFLRQFISRYDAAVFSAPAFSQKLPIPQVLIAPSIDPLGDKNKELDEPTIDAVFARFGIDRSRPVVTQISRFDYLKDPVGVIRAYKLAKERVDMQLVLAGGGATDDPEGPIIMEEVRREAEKDKDIFVLFLPPASDIEINALQRGSTVILQKSLKEGFGLTVSEALWKGKPTIAGAVGGIPLQIAHKYSGILTHSVEGTAQWIKQLIGAPEFARQLGINGREHIRNNFLITRHIKDYLLLFLSLFHEGDVVYL
ncbi:MAG: glycosyltransferase [Deltaproteobacteria bacterium]|nr:glycosyltransferase [Deltaproteobacteria bacterium]MBI2181637.1 glycosyltransferase [Deltaproteobacteria bacterium]MBI2230637.1 glycosyltransferase [Deltaproteobacteria bacterium]MBI2534189.1 glycosyltransferase [Deltaproteobacteria bacterium]MBI3063621.1 glycosyltransferase [Deltaproteobacteria bacterium]